MSKNKFSHIHTPELTQFYESSSFKAVEQNSDKKRREFESIAVNNEPTPDFRRVMVDGMPKIASEFNAGKPIMVNHYRYQEALPRGRTYDASFDKTAKEVPTKFYLDVNDRNKDLLESIDAGTVTDVSFGGNGRFKCSYDNSLMGFFGCRDAGHLRGEEIMLDKDGKQTENPSEMVSVHRIHANFYVESVDELSLVWSGAIPGAGITKVFNANPESNQRIISQVSELYKSGELSEDDLQRMCASYDANSILDNVNLSNKTIFIPSKKEKITVNNENFPPEAQARINELQSAKDKQKEELDAALAQVKELTEFKEGLNLEDMEAAKQHFVELDNNVKKLTKENEELRAKSELYDKFVRQLRDDLKEAKSKQNVTKEQKEAFDTVVDQMVDAAQMSVLLNEMNDDQTNSQAFSRIIKVAKQDESVSLNHEHFDKAELARKQAAY